MPPTATPASTNTAVPTSTPVPPTATPVPTNTPPALASSLLYVTSSDSGTAGGIAFNDEDILVYDLATQTWSLFFDGSDAGMSGDVDGFSLLPDGSLLLSFDAAFTLSSLGSVDDSDIIRFAPSSLGSITSGVAELYFDASDVGLSTSDEDIDMIGFAPDGRLLVSTVGAFSVPGVSGDDVDIIAFAPTQLGATTSGAWSLYFNGSDVELSPGGSEDVYGGWVDPVTGQIYLTTLGSFSVSGVSGGGGDIFICMPGTLGATTTCTFGPGLFWDGAANGFNYVVDGFEIKRQ